jgi:hypothetical protein
VKAPTLGPLLRSARANLGSAGVTVGVTEVGRLQNPSRSAWLLDEIRFRFEPAALTAGYAGACAQIVSVRLELGNLPLTATGYVPVALLCRTLDPSVEWATSATSDMGFVWRLPKPLYIPAGKTVVPTFRLDGSIGYPTPPVVTAYVSMVGRLLPLTAPVPALVEVPFATAWLDAVRGGGVDYKGVRSPKSDLKNPHGEPVYVQQMLGTYFYQSQGSDLTVYVPGTQSQGASNDVDLIGNDLVSARIFKSDGSALARAPTPWNHLFDWSTRSLQGGCAILERNEYYQIQADVLMASRPAQVGAGGFGAWGDKIRLMASLIGYRQVRLRDGIYVEA